MYRKDALMYDDVQETGLKTTCRCCGGADLKWIRKNMSIMAPEPYPLSGDLSVIRCRDCGFIANASVSKNEDYIDYYIHYNKHYTRSGPLGLIDKAYFEGVLDLLEAKGQLDWTSTDVLDFGSGALLFSELATARGARAAYNYDMESPYPAIDYGLVVSTHCFEHVYNFNDEFRRIHGILAKDGLFCVAVPDMRGYDELYYGPYNCFDLEHINHFEITTLTGALARCGFEIVAVRESERRVTETLAYPEVLVIARKAEGVVAAPALASIRKAPETVLQSYLARSEQDLATTLSFVTDKVADYANRGVAASFGVYGLSSYAFRILKRLTEAKFSGFSWMADSDSRLTGKIIAGHAIYSSDDFAAHVEACKAAGTRCVAFICAINGQRIVAYLTERYGDAIDILVIPPDCQNRRPDSIDFPSRRGQLAERNWNNPECRKAVQQWHDASRTFDYQYMVEWMGRPIIQDPQDICAIQELIWRIQPDLIIETGIAHGGSLVLSASVLAAIAQGELLKGGTYTPRKVIGIDIDIRAHNRKAIEEHPLSAMIQLIQGSSVAPEVIAQVAEQAKTATRVMVFLDSNHTHAHVLEELGLYAPFVSSGSALLVLDTGIEYAPMDTFNVTRPWGPGNSPLTAVNTFLASTEGADFSKDRTIERRLLLTCAPEGLLMRA